MHLTVKVPNKQAKDNINNNSKKHGFMDTCKTWLSDCLRHEDASRANYVDLDPHSTSQIEFINIINV